MRPRVCVLADVRGWAWDRKGVQYMRYLVDEFDVHLYHQRDDLPPNWNFDLVHLFEVSQTGHVPESYRSRGGKMIAGLTAHVWQTWGAARMHEWAGRCDALHGNSLLLVDDLKQFHSRVFYTPNGVDQVFWRRTRERDEVFTACHVGKPNPRKGSYMIIEACERLKIPLLLCQRTSHIALPQEQIRDEFYSRAWAQITMSDMDGTPNPALESASCGNMQISTYIGNMPEMIRDGENGFLITRDADALHRALTWCQSHARDVIEMGHEARRTIERDWTWERNCEHVRKMWRAVLT